MMKTTTENSRHGFEPVVESSFQYGGSEAAILLETVSQSSLTIENEWAEFQIEQENKRGPEQDAQDGGEQDAQDGGEQDAQDGFSWIQAEHGLKSDAGLDRTFEHEKLRIPQKTYFKIGEVAQILKVKPYVLRYWETEFPFCIPAKKTSGQRVYTRSDVESLVMIKVLLYQERYSIEGARKKIKELRKDGELRKFKKDRVSESMAQEFLSSEKRRELKVNIDRLKSSAKKPIQDFFRL